MGALCACWLGVYFSITHIPYYSSCLKKKKKPELVNPWEKELAKLSAEPSARPQARLWAVPVAEPWVVRSVALCL
jgi:hypothetical protein